ncbi:hypothetical protein TMatcc_003179 [Talaromyces marneffei ATCC 18224]|uniref:uncharacterized protein n=1 Tax=Talaromyces marneffei TaxID=37727 RepID=UPI0012A77DE1|nr:uncharacterized protein EYB26_001774 [Talaromyces marneffei]KAE8555883.1 hypothetical protein EYB25_000581 [Talaromyces marneffei]QGA14121.1 hypothetical protein EYB26_001774 [Talaromyces marneffei]
MSAIKNVTLVGGTGHLGSFVLDKLLASDKFNVQILQRTSSSSAYAPTVKVVRADFEDPQSLTAVLKGGNAVVSTVGEKGILGQRLLIDAAIAAAALACRQSESRGRHPAETQNRAVYVPESFISQNQLLSFAKHIAPNKPWAPVDADLNVAVAGALERLAQGQHDFPTVIPILLKSVVDNEYGPNFAENDNELLGITEKGDEYLIELLNPLL